MSSCAEYVDKLPVEQVDGIINHNEFYYPTMTNIPAKAQHDIDIFEKYMKRDVPDLKSLVYGELGFHIAVQAADMLRQVKGDITPQTVRGHDADDQGPDVLPGDRLRLLEELLAAGLGRMLRRGIYTRANKDRKKDVLDINPIDVSAVRPKGDERGVTRRA